MSFTPAPIWRRFAAFAYDAMLVIAVWMVATLVLLPFTGGEAVPLSGPWHLAYQAYLTGLAALYFIGFWTRTGQTPGMRAWSISLTDGGGETPRIRAAVIHFLVGIPVMLTAGLLLAAARLTPDRRALHEKAAHTRVIRKPLKDNAS
ncbi:MAG: RDD family protein [Halothiobacillaceae bacterium]